MPSSQKDYSYEELKHYLDVSKTALKNFEERYPDLSFEHIHPRILANRVINDFRDEVNKLLVEEIAYLEPIDDGSVAIGSVCNVDHKAKREKAEELVERAVQAFDIDLRNLYETHLASILVSLLRLRDITTPFTVGRIDKHTWHKEWVQKQQEHYENYHIRESSKYSAAKDLELRYVGNSIDVPEISGVYFLYHEGIIIYIGHSRNLNERLNNHETVRKYYCKENGTGYKIDCVYAELPVPEAQSVERKLIAVAKPTQNRQGKT